MSREKKGDLVKKIEGLLADHEGAVVTDFRGMSVGEMRQLRNQLRESGVKYHVVKDSLARLAADRSDREELKGLLQGPSAIAFSHEEISGPAKIISDYIRSSKASLSIRGGLLGERLLSSEDVATLSALPSKEILVSQVMQRMQAPISALVGILSANLGKIVGVLKARKQQLEGG